MKLVQLICLIKGHKFNHPCVDGIHCFRNCGFISKDPYDFKDYRDFWTSNSIIRLFKND